LRRIAASHSRLTDIRASSLSGRNCCGQVIQAREKVLCAEHPGERRKRARQSPADEATDMQTIGEVRIRPAATEGWSLLDHFKFPGGRPSYATAGA
jgi:hypothetical protein